MNNLELYYLSHCPYCKKVLRTLDELGFSIDFDAAKAAKNDTTITLKDVGKFANFKAELLQGGGKTTVPCLRTVGDNNEWMYESGDIMKHLKKVFA